MPADATRSPPTYIYNAGDPTIITDQLQRSKESDPKGLAVAFASALQAAAHASSTRPMADDASAPAHRVVDTLIQFHAEAKHVEFDMVRALVGAQHVGRWPAFVCSSIRFACPLPLAA